jgi:sugar lactone lactonase YvrE
MAATTTPLIGGLDFPESPRWHEGSLWFSDMQRHAICRLRDGRCEDVHPMAEMPGGLGWDAHGRLLVVAVRSRRVLMRESDGWSIYADFAGLPGGVCNDLLVDSAGHAYISTLDGLGPVAEPTPILLATGAVSIGPAGAVSIAPAGAVSIAPAGAVSIASAGLLRGNGMALHSDGRLLIAETAAGRITCFDVDGAGRLHNRALFADLAGRRPDGICIERDDTLWVADLAGREVVRVAEGAGVIAAISTGDRFAVACAVSSGTERRLYVCTAAHLDLFGTPPPSTGRIEIADLPD